jgi:hypothetical protein
MPFPKKGGGGGRFVLTHLSLLLGRHRHPRVHPGMAAGPRDKRVNLYRVR